MVADQAQRIDVEQAGGAQRASSRQNASKAEPQVGDQDLGRQYEPILRKRPAYSGRSRT